MKALREKAKKQGWVVVVGSRHWKWQSPQGGVVFSAATPSDYRGYKNHIRMLRRYGYQESKIK